MIKEYSEDKKSFSNFKLIGKRSILIFAISFFYWIAVSTCHLIVTDFLTDWVATPWGKFIPRDSSLETGLVVTILLIIYIFYMAIKGKRRIISFIYWILLGSSVWLAYRFLIAAQIEIIHFPQYAILSFLFAYAIDPERKKVLIVSILFWVTLMGIVDEAYQYFYITRLFSHYFDFNDFILNEIGVALGLFLFYGFREIPSRKIGINDIWKSLEFKVVVSIILLFLSFSLLGIIHSYTHTKLETPIIYEHGFLKIYLERLPNKIGSWQERDLGGYFYTLDSLTGTSIMVLFGFLISLYQYELKEKLTLGRKFKSNLSKS